MIENYIIQNNSVTLDQICMAFNVSKSTLRRDLEEILKNKDIKKIYGGVAFKPQKPLISFEKRNIVNINSKKLIASKAAEFVQDGDIIFIDSGTTTLQMFEGLIGKNNITILTNNLEFIFFVLPYDNISVISLSGTLNRKTSSFTGSMAADVLSGYNISKAFMATTGFSPENGVTNSSPTESNIKQVAVNRSQQVFLLADKTKFNAFSLITYCGLDKIDMLITDMQPPSNLERALAQNNVSVTVCK